MWYDNLPADSTWAALWRGYILCSRCRGIRTVTDACPACTDPVPSLEPTTIRTEDGQEIKLAATFFGAEGRYEDWVFLILLEREWKRSTTTDTLMDRIAERHRPSERSAFVLLFWTYFETRVERLLRQAMSTVSEPILSDVLQRYSSIGARLDRLYRLLFETTYWTDLEDLGYGQVAALLRDVQNRRNRFVHGHPEAIDDATVQRLGADLKLEHEAWIAVFNRRASLLARKDP
jgi:hypothetical protein